MPKNLMLRLAEIENTVLVSIKMSGMVLLEQYKISIIFSFVQVKNRSDILRQSMVRIACWHHDGMTNIAI